MKHQRRASDTQFTKHGRVKYEPLSKNKMENNLSPRVNQSKQKLRDKLLSQRGVVKPYNEVEPPKATEKLLVEDMDTGNHTFYERNKNKNTSSFYNHRSFLLKDHTYIPNPKISAKSAIKKKSKNKTKVQNSSKRKSHTKGNNSVYMKDFEKLMKERSQLDNKSLKRIQALRSSDDTDFGAKAKIYAPPQCKKSVKKIKKNPNITSNKQLYHKRVKSDQIYSVKLLLRGDDKLKNNKIKQAYAGDKQPSLTRPSTKKHKSINMGYNNFVFKKSKGVQNTLLNPSTQRNTFRSENCTPRKLKSLNRLTYESS